MVFRLISPPPQPGPAIGEPSRTRDFGELGVRFWYDDHGLSGLLAFC